MEKFEGDFLKGKYWQSEEFRRATEDTAKRTEVREGRTVPNEPEERIENYLKRFTDIFDRKDLKDREYGIEALKRLLHKKYLTNPDSISDDYIKGVLFGNFAEQKGYNRSDLKDPDIKQSVLEQFKSETGRDFASYVIPEDEKDKVKEMSLQDQSARLDSWFDYLTGPEALNYPVAYRYWALAEMLKLGSYDDERKVYNKRTEDTAAPFPELDQQALALVMDEVARKQQGEPSQLILEDQTEFRKRLQAENFGKLYAFTQEHLKSLRLPNERLPITKGEWQTFPKGSDPKEVVKTLNGFHTQWCIAGEGTAGNYLSHSDLYVYLSEDAEGNNTIPRACIVDSKERGITEVRGIMSDENAKQHLDDYITPVVEDKLSSLEGGEKWQGQMTDMKTLAKIHLKYRQRETLTKADLAFLYQVDHGIQTTGYNEDPRIAEILKGRDIESDIPIIFECAKEQIAHHTEEIDEATKVYIGPIDPTNLSAYAHIPNLYDKEFPNKRVEFKDPKAQDFKTLKDDINFGKAGEYTVNPEMAGINFENLSPDKIKIIELPKKFEGKPLHEGAEYVMEKYGDTHHIPGIELRNWIYEKSESAPQDIKEKFKGLKDGNHHFFIGSVVRVVGGYWRVPHVFWGGSDWYRDDDWLDRDWSGRYRVLLLEK